MSVSIVPLRASHLEDAALLVAWRYRAMRLQRPQLPPRYDEPAEFLPLIGKLAAKYPGVAAVDGEKLVGFLTGWMLPEFRGKPTVYSPEWGNAAAVASSRLYQDMYATMAKQWVDAGYFDHLLTMFAHDSDGINAWQWLGFGYVVVDAIRDLTPVAGAVQGLDIRRAGPADLALALPLWQRLWQHLGSAPTFLVDVLDARPEQFAGWLADAGNALWLAYVDGKPVASLGIGPASQNACTVIRDRGTASITSAFTDPSARGGGLASSLLDKAIAWARESGYVRCSVDFESANSQAARFWPRHFQPICMSLGRHVNERIADYLGPIDQAGL